MKKNKKDLEKKIKVKIVKSWEPLDLTCLYEISEAKKYGHSLEQIISATNSAYIITPSKREYVVDLGFDKEYDPYLKVDIDRWRVKYGGNKVNNKIVGVYISSDDISYEEKSKIAKYLGGKLRNVYLNNNGLYDETDYVVFIPIKKNLKNRDDANKELKRVLKKFKGWIIKNELYKD